MDLEPRQCLSVRLFLISIVSISCPSVSLSPSLWVVRGPAASYSLRWMCEGVFRGDIEGRGGGYMLGTGGGEVTSSPGTSSPPGCSGLIKNRTCPPPFTDRPFLPENKRFGG